MMSNISDNNMNKTTLYNQYEKDSTENKTIIKEVNPQDIKLKPSRISKDGDTLELSIRKFL